MVCRWFHDKETRRCRRGVRLLDRAKRGLPPSNNSRPHFVTGTGATGCSIRTSYSAASLRRDPAVETRRQSKSLAGWLVGSAAPPGTGVGSEIQPPSDVCSSFTAAGLEAIQFQHGEIAGGGSAFETRAVSAYPDYRHTYSTSCSSRRADTSLVLQALSPLWVVLLRTLARWLSTECTPTRPLPRQPNSRRQAHASFANEALFGLSYS